jgi:hypothetical protein
MFVEGDEVVIIALSIEGASVTNVASVELELPSSDDVEGLEDDVVVDVEGLEVIGEVVVDGEEVVVVVVVVVYYPSSPSYSFNDSYALL